MKNMSHNACSANPRFSLIAVPLGFNLNRCRFRVRVAAHSDTSKFLFHFYQYHGMYWYSLTQVGGRFYNSVSFVSMRNACQDCASLIRSLRLVNDTPLNFRELVKVDQSERQKVAEEHKTTWRI